MTRPTRPSPTVSRARHEREKAARAAAEHIAETRSRELYEANLQLASEAARLERMVAERTAELQAARDRAEAATRAKGEFLANMSHELRTPLNAILGFSEIIKDQVLGPTGNPEYSNYATDIHVSGQHLLSLINDILDLSKVEAGKFQLLNEELDLFGIVDDVRRLLSLRAEQKGVVLENLVRRRVIVRADLSALRRVFINLMSNALKFTPAGRRITVTFEQDESFCGVKVTDEGCGIQPDDIERVFERFGQGRHDVALEEKGTGLGLPIARGLMRAHGGDLRLTSQPGVGTVAHASLPLSRIIALPLDFRSPGGGLHLAGNGGTQAA